MAWETEIKLRVRSLEAVRSKLHACSGARKMGVFHEFNLIFDTPSASLLNDGRGLRIRTSRDQGTGDDHVTLTAKGPVGRGLMKSREEVEIRVDDAASCEALLILLGYRRVLEFPKVRERWEVDSCHVDLDELPSLGEFVEIEGLDEQAILRVRDRLGLADAEHEARTYVEMLASQPR